jgi:hypothetical protein
VEFLERVEHPAARFHTHDEADRYVKLLERFHNRPSREKERFAHAYAEQLRHHLLAIRAIPFDRELDRERLMQDRLRVEDFDLS